MRRGQAPAARTAGVAAIRWLFDELGQRFKDRPGGYTRIIKMGRRTGDGAELAIIELVDNAREKEAQATARKRVKGSTKKRADETKATETAADQKEEAGSEE